VSGTKITYLSQSGRRVDQIISICIVHGLDGNSMDTFTCEPQNTKSDPPVVWPRDLLPKRTGFENTRIVTYGYNSRLFDRHSSSNIRVWSKNLLKDLEKVADADKASSVTSQNIVFSLQRVAF
jgi:hypothetical protein